MPFLLSSLLFLFVYCIYVTTIKMFSDTKECRFEVEMYESVILFPYVVNL